MDYDSDRSSEATQLEENSTAEVTMHPHDDANTEDSDDDDDQRPATPFQYSPTSQEENSTTSQSPTLAVSDLSVVPVKFEMQDELDRLKNQLQGSHQEALATVIAQAARVHSQGQNLSPTLNADVAESDQKNAIDGYNWRKYGQKQVKSPQGSRSYYKCTYTECDAKKIESFDQFNSKVVYKGEHKHDPPINNILPNPKSVKRKSISTLNQPQQKQRAKKSINPKKPKFVVHAADDVEISADGYRWRKYGQKMVKGNFHPRNYYKCTCAGCGVTKQIEKAVDGTSSIVITYKGVHDHDKPVPKKRRVYGHGHGHGHGDSVASLESKRLLSVGEVVNKRNESAPTLLSVGFEIKHC